MLWGAGQRARILLAGALLLVVVAVAGCSAASTASTPSVTATGDPAVAALVAGVKVNQAELKLDLQRITGVTAAPVGAGTIIIRTRYAGSGAPVKAAQAYVCGQLKSYGLDAVRYQAYGAAPASRNVVGEIRGSTRPKEIIVVGAHLDDMPAVGRAPGADDNGASCAALLYLAKHLAGHDPARTVRFVFFGGEEIGNRGSWFAAQASRRSHETIVGMINVDAVAWNANGSRVVEVHRRPLGAGASARGDQRLANAFVRAIATYRITGVHARVLVDGLDWSDHYTFWRSGFGAIWLYEDSRGGDDPNWHTSHDDLASLSWDYYVSVTQALIATVADVARLRP